MQASFILRSLTDTQQIAERFIYALPEGGTLALSGDLGSGKTTFVQALGRSLGINEAMPSPTFTLSNEYRLAKSMLIHADLYRLDTPEAIQHIGLTDYFNQPHTYLAVEWADRLPKLFPDGTLWLTFVLVQDHRILTVTGGTSSFWHAFAEGRA